MKARLMTTVVLFILTGLITACSANTVPLYRIGIVMPFAGRTREIGYDVFFAARLALLEALENESMDGYRVELVLLDDFGDPDNAAVHAAALVDDARVLVAIGHWLPETTRAALPVYADAGLALITTSNAAVSAAPGRSNVFVLAAHPADQQAALADYLAAHEINPDTITLIDPGLSVTAAAALTREATTALTLSGPPGTTREFGLLTTAASATRWSLTHTVWPVDLPSGADFTVALLASDASAREPGPFAALAYDATAVAMDAIRRAAVSGSLTRPGVANALPATDLAGLTGPLRFDADGFRQDAPLYLYEWHNDTSAPVLLERLR